MTTRPKFTDVEALIVSKELRAGSLQVTFRCPQSGVEASAKAKIQKQNDVQSTVERSVKGNLWKSLRTQVSSAISGKLGSGVAGRIAKDVTNKAIADKQKAAKHSSAELEEAVVSAFEAVRAQFRWDEARVAWVGIEAPGAAAG